MTTYHYHVVHGGKAGDDYNIYRWLHEIGLLIHVGSIRYVRRDLIHNAAPWRWQADRLQLNGFADNFSSAVALLLTHQAPDCP